MMSASVIRSKKARNSISEQTSHAVMARIVLLQWQRVHGGLDGMQLGYNSMLLKSNVVVSASWESWDSLSIYRAGRLTATQLHCLDTI